MTRRTEISLTKRVTLVVLFQEETNRVAFRIMREVNGHRVYEGPYLKLEDVNALAALRRLEENARVTIRQEGHALALLVHQGRLFVHWDEIDYRVSAAELGEAIALPEPPREPFIGPPPPSVIKEHEAPPLHEFVQIRIGESPRGGPRYLRVEKRRGDLYFAIAIDEKPIRPTLRRDNLNVLDDHMAGHHSWLTQGTIAIRRISGSRFGVYQTNGLVGHLQLPELHAAMTKLGFRLAPAKSDGKPGRTAWEMRPRDDEWTE